MSTQISKAESWDRIYQASKFINFTSFDYNTVKQSLIDYFKLYHPEFNNYIESDEFIMIIEAFAYVCELYSYRLDMVANENLLSTATRRDSILNLAKFISYTPSRNIPGIGLVKITSIKTNEVVYDINGNNLQNVVIKWNDANNINWKSQFFTVINATIEQDFGDVLPSNRVQIFDQVFELYTLKNKQIPVTNGVVGYSINIHNKSVNFELVSSELNDNGPYEQPPGISSGFNILYGSDGLGDTSNFTGFFILTKQGSIAKESHTFSGNTKHDSYTINKSNINNIDVWVNQLYGKTAYPWKPVDTTFAQNVVFNTTQQGNVFEIETLDNDQVKVVFGDGEFADIPKGTFDFWYRVSDPDPVPVLPNNISEISTNFAYANVSNQFYDFTVTFSLIQPIQNASSTEDKEHIKLNAPSVYYTQDRMVNGADYNSYPLQDSSILKLKSVNRTFSGQSAYTIQSDPTGIYNNTNYFGNDLSVYVNNYEGTVEYPAINSAASIMINYIQPILANNAPNEIYRLSKNISLRRFFTETELHDIIFDSLGEKYLITDGIPVKAVFPIAIYFENNTYKSRTYINDNSWIFFIDKKDKWVVKYKASEIIAHSPTTRFYSNNNDDIVILQMNTSNSRTKKNSPKLEEDIIFPINGPVIYTNTTAKGIIDNSRVQLTLPDINNDGIPDIGPLDSLLNNNILVDFDSDNFYEEYAYSRLFNRVFDMPFDSDNIILPTIEMEDNFITSDVTLTGDVDPSYKITWKESTQSISNTITITDAGPNTKIDIHIDEYVYFHRDNIEQAFVPTDISAMPTWLLEEKANNHIHYDRKMGRRNLNFLWRHEASNDSRINPSSSNFIDCYVITKGYYHGMMNWIKDNSYSRPEKPTPQNLRSTYSHLMPAKMMSDELVIRSGTLKIIFGKYAEPELKAKFLVIPSPTSKYNDNQIKLIVVSEIYKYFDINNWDFGQTFNFTDMATHIHNVLDTNIQSIVIKPIEPRFGKLFQIFAREDEILVPCVSINDIELVSYLPTDITNY